MRVICVQLGGQIWRIETVAFIFLVWRLVRSLVRHRDAFELEPRWVMCDLCSIQKMSYIRYFLNPLMRDYFSSITIPCNAAFVVHGGT